MLTELRIRNLAIIESVTLPLANGLNVLSGETGAGKSIIVGALGLLLGERAHADMVRTGAERATVEGVFDIAQRDDLLAVADARGIETNGGTLVLKREVASSGRGRAWINGTPVTATVLSEIGRVMVNIHGQHEAQSLLDTESQRAIVDAYGDAGRDADAVREAFAMLQMIRKQIRELTTKRAQVEKRAEYLRHVVQEIGEANIEPGEDDRLDDEARVLENADELRTVSASIGAALTNDEAGLLSNLNQLQRLVAQVQKLDGTKNAARLQELLDTGYYALEELARTVDDYGASVELDPERLQIVRDRQAMLYMLTKKYGGSLDDVIKTGEEARAELEMMEGSGFDVEQLKVRQADAQAELEKRAKQLTKTRTASAKQIAKAVEALLPQLGMEGGRFLVALEPCAEIGATGAEDIEFRVSLNVGYEPRPLSRVASGGEMSRVMLALKTTLARVDHIPTLVFDEVDAGIGGRVGLQVGDTMRQVAAQHQVFAISHLPQIAARAHHHIVVAKGAKGGVTTADITVVKASARVAEIARMLGGDPESKVSRAHAKELLAAAG